MSKAVTDERSHDTKHLPALVQQASSSGRIVKALAEKQDAYCCSFWRNLSDG